jgi:hydroxypyruvate reductase
VSAAGENDLILVLVSGGGSSLFAAPAPGLSLEDLIAVNQLLLTSGAEITEINIIRKHLSAVKGGQLARIAAPAAVTTLLLSDVVGDSIDMIASGPTAPDPSTYQEALEVVDKYDLQTRVPPSIIRHLQKGEAGQVEETPKPGDPYFQKGGLWIVGSNQDAIQAGIQQARREGFNTGSLPFPLQGEALKTGQEAAFLLRQMAATGNPLQRPACMIGGGETTVTLPPAGASGRGGRNLEMALGAVQTLQDAEDAVLITLATDGEDGETDAAGGVVTGDSYQRGYSRGLEPEAYLADHNSYAYFQALDDLLLPGVTHTNVNDLCFLFTG